MAETPDFLDARIVHGLSGLSRNGREKSLLGAASCEEIQGFAGGR
jgi:hypothetical protein